MMTSMGHPTDKIELIVMGGTFLAYPADYQYRFIKGCYDALNGRESKTLEEAKQLNEQAGHRCVGLCIETRPDWCGQTEIDRMLEFGATRVELGVQMLDDNVYRIVRRGHTVEDVVKATRLLREHAFKVHYHWMPGLPGSSPEKDLALSRQLFSDERFRPDGLKIYPTMVVEGTELEKWYKEGRYQPYPDETMTNLVADIKAIVPPYVRISRVLRDIPSQFVTGGLKDSLRDVVKQRMKQQGKECQCIRCREYGHRVRSGQKPGEAHLVRMDYDASGGREILLSFEDKQGTLFGLLRLRIQDNLIAGLSEATHHLHHSRESGNPEDIDNRIPNQVGNGKFLSPSALIRELHIYGPEVPLNRHPSSLSGVEGLSSRLPGLGGQAQHKGLGKALLAEAERIARDEFGAKNMAVLSGVGAREYYRAGGGYRLQAGYMVKKLAPESEA